jgi:hypothetical protein
MAQADAKAPYSDRTKMSRFHQNQASFAAEGLVLAQVGAAYPVALWVVAVWRRGGCQIPTRAILSGPQPGPGATVLGGLAPARVPGHASPGIAALQTACNRLAKTAHGSIPAGFQISSRTIGAGFIT